MRSEEGVAERLAVCGFCCRNLSGKMLCNPSAPSGCSPGRTAPSASRTCLYNGCLGIISPVRRDENLPFVHNTCVIVLWHSFWGEWKAFSGAWLACQKPALGALHKAGLSPNGLFCGCEVRISSCLVFQTGFQV